MSQKRKHECTTAEWEAIKVGNTARQRKLRATPEGRAAHSARQRERRATPEGRAAQNAANKAWKQANPAKHNALGAKRRAAKLQRTPPWADLKAIEAVYDLRAFCNSVAGPAAVDHVVPLQGDDVSGLHVHTNLQILPAAENIAKSNRFDTDVYVHQLPNLTN
jgi:hypothetical protein